MIPHPASFFFAKKGPIVIVFPFQCQIGIISIFNVFQDPICGYIVNCHCQFTLSIFDAPWYHLSTNVGGPYFYEKM